ncbi:hypothetical protein KAF25_005680 [Fusarium avenaceum]|uniref:Uncharacterized protein n=1 Tax=Fusarium avenaceum TaxID=40199 RepID=A0A9P7KT55_9HYPO|nr:hypothetical protein KAF25_005680 [Fusarium avenaceum]
MDFSAGFKDSTQRTMDLFILTVLWMDLSHGIVSTGQADPWNHSPGLPLLLDRSAVLELKVALGRMASQSNLIAFFVQPHWISVYGHHFDFRFSCLFLDTMDAKDLMTALHNHLWIPLADDA